MSNPQNPLFCQGKFGKWSKRLHMKLLVIVWHTIVYNNASITFYVPHISPTAIFVHIKICPPRESRHFHFDRQYGTCTGTIYTLDTNITVSEGRYTFCPENWLAIPCHNRHMSCPGLSPPDLSVYGKYLYLTGQSWTTTYDRYGTK